MGSQASYRQHSIKIHAGPSTFFLTGIQALVRLPNGSNSPRPATASHRCFVRLYTAARRFGGYYQQFAAALKPLEHTTSIHPGPASNEYLAATAIWGSQAAQSFPGSRHGWRGPPPGIWYGKGPGSIAAGYGFRHGIRGLGENGGVCCALPRTLTARNTPPLPLSRIHGPSSPR